MGPGTVTGTIYRVKMEVERKGKRAKWIVLDLGMVVVRGVNILKKEPLEKGEES